MMEVIDMTMQLTNCSGVSWHQLSYETLIAEAHAGLFSGHLSEWKVYDQLHRQFWWHGM